MKNIVKSILFFSMLAVAVSACKKEENKNFLEAGTAPVLTASSDQLLLGFVTESEPAITFSWTNPDYKFTTGVSSQTVAYLLEIDTAGINFTGGLKKKQISFSGNLSKTFLQKEINEYLLNTLQLAANTTHTIEVRVVAGISGSPATNLISNVLTFTVRPYSIPPKVNPPAAATLYITGSATPASWMGGGDPEVLSQKFTRLSETLYELTVNLNGGASYLFVPRYGNWSAVSPDPEKYGFTGANNGNNVNGDDFKPFGGDMLSPAASGTYKIVVDFQRGKFTVTRI